LKKNKNHKRKNNTSTYISIKDIKKHFNLQNLDHIKCKSPNNYKIKPNIIQNIHKQDPNLHLINKLAYKLENDLDSHINKENNNLEYKNDFNKLYKIIRVANCGNNYLDINNLLDIIEKQDLIIKDLFVKVYYLKQQIKDNIFIDKNKIENNNILKDEIYFDKKLDIIIKIYEKEKQELIRKQEDMISKIKIKYNMLKDKYLDVLKHQKDKKIINNEEINDIIKKIKIDQFNMNINTNKLSKINDDLNIAEFCMNEHFNELIFKLGKIKDRNNNKKK
jgi:hypothetical protein